MKRFININTKQYYLFAENESELSISGAIDCTQGIMRWTDIKYKNCIETTQEVFPVCNSKYIKVVDNQLIEMSQTEKDEVDRLEQVNIRKQEFFGKRYKISIKIDTITDTTNPYYDNLQKLKEYCMNADFIKRNVFEDVDGDDCIAIYMNTIKPKHQTFLQNLVANNYATFEDAENMQTVIIE